MIAAGDVLRITQFFRKGSIQAVNVSFWRVAPSPALGTINMSDVVFMIAESWQEKVGEFLVDSAAVYYRTLLEIAPDFIEFAENVFDRPGGQSGDAAPSFVAAQVRQLVATRTTRGGYKRIPFLIEANVSGNTFTTTPVIREGVEMLYGDTWDVQHIDYPDVQFDLKPIIVGRTNIGTPEEPDYILDFARTNDVVEASLTKVTHQNSRDT